MDLEYIVRNQYYGYKVYGELARGESSSEFKKILRHLSKHELGDYEFWRRFSQKKEFQVPHYQLFLFKLMRQILGLTFTARFLERHEKELVERYTRFIKTIKDPQLKKEIYKVIKHEEEHEEELISQIKEEKIAFISSIILGLNDGLIELTGALVGFSFALGRNSLVALTGLITGLAASLSMASSAYMQAKYEPGKHPGKAALYTGVTYIGVVLLLLLPFVLTSSIYPALGVLLVFILIIITSISYFTSIIFERSFIKQFVEMISFSVGVAIITFLFGLALRHFTAI